jgi:hypothetical protein
MMSARTAVFILAALASVSLVASTGGITAISADRGLGVAVVSDDDAYLEIDVRKTEEYVNRSFEVLRLEDQFSQDVDLEHISISGTNKVSLVAAPKEMDSHTDIRVKCTEAGGTDVTFDITVGTQGVTANLERTIHVICREDDDEDDTEIEDDETPTPDATPTADETPTQTPTATPTPTPTQTATQTPESG